MKKIENWADIKESTGFKHLEPNAYVCAIWDVEDNEEKEYFKILFDIIEGENKGCFKKQFNEDTRSDKKWPSAGSFIRSYKVKALPLFKGMLTAIDNSNKNTNLNDKMEKHGYIEPSDLKNKKFVLIIGDEEYLNQNGQKRTRNYVSAIRSIDAYEKKDFTIPELKKLDESKVVASNNSAPANFTDPFADAAVPETKTTMNTNPWGDDDDPFNS